MTASIKALFAASFGLLVSLLSVAPLHAQQVIEMEPIVIYGRSPDGPTVVSEELVFEDALVRIYKITYSDGSVRMEGRPTKALESLEDLGQDSPFGQEGAADGSAPRRQHVAPGEGRGEPMPARPASDDFEW